MAEGTPDAWGLDALFTPAVWSWPRWMLRPGAERKAGTTSSLKAGHLCMRRTSRWSTLLVCLKELDFFKCGWLRPWRRKPLAKVNQLGKYSPSCSPDVCWGTGTCGPLFEPPNPSCSPHSTTWPPPTISTAILPFLSTWHQHLPQWGWGKAFALWWETRPEKRW